MDIVKTLSKQLNVSCDVSDVYRTLCYENESDQDKALNMSALLETASISTKEHTRSIVVFSSALRIRCFGEEVTIEALNGNGKQLLAVLSEHFQQCHLIKDGIRLTYDHKALKASIDESEKLSKANVLDVLRQVLKTVRTESADDRTTLLVGTFSFDCYQLFEDLPALEQEQTFPDYDFYLADRLLIVDHINHSSRLISKVFVSHEDKSSFFDYQQQLSIDEQNITALQPKKRMNFTPSKRTSACEINIDNQTYTSLVNRAKEHIVAGDVFQMVLARDFSMPCSDALLAYQALRLSNPSPYMFFVSTPEYQLLGASPESAVKYTVSNNRLSIYPIAGTRRRGLTETGSIDNDLDARIELELKNDEKEKAEHLMLVDLARNDVARVSHSGSRTIDRLLEIDRYSHVMHLVSKVSGSLKDNLDALSAYQACMNMGTLSGAPKVKATQLIRTFENKYRGVYGGAMGYLNAAGDMDTAIVIRSALVQNNVAMVSAGAGIVFDSQPEFEIKETENKAAAVLFAIEAANALFEQRTEVN
ncbi:anthranilate synthase component 1 [Pleionea sediminis]|uniref:anthranilate synthase component 1 n=1 Tax=Pleionea sediminis TaxID=2569479 RepID=UPI0013DE73F6|nr:anthranilate synthase component 1 [Pleionea sediminis]